MCNYHIHKVRFQANAFNFALHHHFLARLKKIPEFPALTVSEIETKGDPLQFFRFRPHPGVLQHVGIFFSAFIIEIADNCFGAIF